MLMSANFVIADLRLNLKLKIRLSSANLMLKQANLRLKRANAGSNWPT